MDRILRGDGMKVCDMIEKPREKALLKGVKSLSDVELLTLVIQSGSRKMSAYDIAHALLKEVQCLGGLHQLTLSKLLTYDGIGKVKAIHLLGVIELCSRMNQKQINEDYYIKNAQSVYHYLISEYGMEMQEVFYALYLDVKNKVIFQKEIFRGSLDVSIVHPREVYKEAVSISAAAIIVAHNHPSGDPTPSPQDIETTSMLRQTGEVMKIPLLDHVILGRNQLFSFREAKML